MGLSYKDLLDVALGKKTLPVEPAQPKIQLTNFATGGVKNYEDLRTAPKPSTQRTATPMPQQPSPRGTLSYLPMSIAETVAPAIREINQVPATEDVFSQQKVSGIQRFLSPKSLITGKASLFEQSIPSALKTVTQDVAKYMAGLPIEFGKDVYNGINSLLGNNKIEEQNIPVLGKYNTSWNEIGKLNEENKKLFKEQGINNETAAGLLGLTKTVLIDNVLRAVATAGIYGKVGNTAGLYKQYEPFYKINDVPLNEIKNIGYTVDGVKVKGAGEKATLDEIIFGKSNKSESFIKDSQGNTGIVKITKNGNTASIEIWKPRNIKPKVSGLLTGESPTTRPTTPVVPQVTQGRQLQQLPAGSPVIQVPPTQITPPAFQMTDSTKLNALAKLQKQLEIKLDKALVSEPAQAEKLKATIEIIKGQIADAQQNLITASGPIQKAPAVITANAPILREVNNTERIGVNAQRTPNIPAPEAPQTPKTAPNRTIATEVGKDVLYNGSNRIVTKKNIDLSNKKIVTLVGDQKEIFGVKTYPEADKKLIDNYSGKFDFVKIVHPENPQKGDEYFSLKDKKWYSKDENVAKAYSIQSRGEKYVKNISEPVKEPIKREVAVKVETKPVKEDKTRLKEFKKEKADRVSKEEEKIKRLRIAQEKAKKEIEEGDKVAMEIAKSEKEREKSGDVVVRMLTPEEKADLEIRRANKAKEEAVVNEIVKINKENKNLKDRKKISLEQYKGQLEKLYEEGKDKDYFTKLYMKEQERELNFDIEPTYSKADAIFDFTESKFGDLFLKGMKQTRIGDFESRVSDSSKPFKLYEEMYRIINKYSPKNSVISNKYLPKGVAGSMSRESLNTSVRNLLDIPTVAHELTHSVDLQEGISKKILDDNLSIVINELSDFYMNNYPKAKTTETTTNKVLEGVATFVEKYIEAPSNVNITNPNLVRQIIFKDGRYYSEKLSSMIEDFEEVISKFQGLTRLQKFGSTIMDDNLKLEIKDKDWNGFIDKAISVVADEPYRMEKISSLFGENMTDLDPSVALRFVRKIRNLSINNSTPGLGFYSFDENFQPYLKYDKNWGDLVKSLTENGVTLDFGYYLKARSLHYDIIRKKELENKVNDESLSEKEVKAIQDNIDRLTNIIDSSQFSIPEIEKTYQENKDIFGQYEMLHDLFTKEYVEVLHNVHILNEEAYKDLSTRKGYAGSSIYKLDELAGENSYLGKPSIGNAPVSVLKVKKGSSGINKNPLYRDIEMSNEVFLKSAKQYVNNQIYEFANRNKQIYVERPANSEGPNIVKAYDKEGKMHKIEIPNIIADIIKNQYDTTNIPILDTLLGVYGKLFRAGKTSSNITFAISNLSLDIPSTYILSSNDVIPVIDGIKAFAKYIKDPEERKIYRLYVALGGPEDVLVNMGQNYSSPKLALSAISGEVSLFGKLFNAANKTSNFISYPSRKSELMNRYSEFRASILGGKSAQLAIEEAARVSFPWGHSGSWGHKALRMLFIKGRPFSNVPYQVYHSMYEAMKDPAKRKKAAGVTLAYTVLKLAELYMIYKSLQEAYEIYSNSKEESEKIVNDYLSKEAFERSNYLNIPGTDKRFRGMEQLTLPGTLISMLLINKMVSDRTDKTPFAPKDFVESFFSALPKELNLQTMFTDQKTYLAGILPNIFIDNLLPLLGYRQFPKVSKLESTGMQFLPTEERYNRYTTEWAKELAQTDIAKSMNLSPVQIDEFIKYWGYIPLLMANIGSKQIESTYNAITGNESPEDKKVVDQLIERFSRGFTKSFIKPDVLFTGRQYNKFFENRDKVTQEYTSEKNKIGTTVDDNFEISDNNIAFKNSAYKAMSPIISDLKEIDDYGIDIPVKYQNYITTIIDLMNNGKYVDASNYFSTIKNDLFTFAEPLMEQMNEEKINSKMKIREQILKERGEL